MTALSVTVTEKNGLFQALKTFMNEKEKAYNSCCHFAT